MSILLRFFSYTLEIRVAQHIYLIFFQKILLGEWRKETTTYSGFAISKAASTRGSTRWRGIASEKYQWDIKHIKSNYRKYQRLNGRNSIFYCRNRICRWGGVWFKIIFDAYSIWNASYVKSMLQIFVLLVPWKYHDNIT